MGVTPKFIETSWPSILTGLLTDDYDIIISGLSLTPQRALLINFSEPYSYSVSTLLANRHLAANFRSKEQFNKKTITIGVVKDSVGEQPLRQQFPKATIKTFTSEPRLIDELLAGKIYAMVSSTPKTGYLLNSHKDVLFQPEIDQISRHAEGFGVRKGDADMLNFLNTWIQYNTQNNWLPRWATLACVARIALELNYSMHPPLRVRPFFGEKPTCGECCNTWTTSRQVTTVH